MPLKVFRIYWHPILKKLIEFEYYNINRTLINVLLIKCVTTLQYKCNASKIVTPSGHYPWLYLALRMSALSIVHPTTRPVQNSMYSIRIQPI